MIFVTVGTQLPFDRLVDAMDQIAGQVREEVIAQTGALGSWKNLTAVPSLSMERLEEKIREARVIVGHAGIGTVLAARAAGRPLIVVPRRAALGEHRNDHQLATARSLTEQTGVWVAWDTSDVAGLLDQELTVASGDQHPLQDSLVSAVRAFALA